MPAAQTVRRLSGINVETSAVFNMATQFGGGKTHSLTVLYHLARGGPAGHGWAGVASPFASRNCSEVSPSP